jgi:hypothetical protein
MALFADSGNTDIEVKSFSAYTAFLGCTYECGGTQCHEQGAQRE